MIYISPGTNPVYNSVRISGSKTWMKVTYFVALPAVIVCFINAQVQEAEHREHAREDFIAYDHLRMRTKVRNCSSVIDLF